jgi:hypothetical protein
MATRRHGQNGRLYVDISSGAAGSAVPVSTIADSKRSFNTDTVEVTAYEDVNKVYVAGKPDASSTYTGFLDIAQDQLWYPSQDGKPRKFYDYIDTVNDPNKYWFGQGIFDFAVEQSTTSGIAITVNMKPATAVTRQWT